MSGFTGLFFAIAVGFVIAAATGWLYGLLLNRLKGRRDERHHYVGFSVVSLMCIAWLVLPFKSPIMKWPWATPAHHHWFVQLLTATCAQRFPL